MKIHFPVRTFFLLIALSLAVSAQIETITNVQVIDMTKAGIAESVILKKIANSPTNFDQTTKGLIELKSSGVSDSVMSAILEKTNAPTTEPVSTKKDPDRDSASSAVRKTIPTAKEALTDAKTISFEKSSVNPSRQALEKELLKRADWKNLNLGIERYREKADLYVEIGFVPMSIITHRYVYRIYDRRSGTVIAAGETTSWGSLAKNLAQHISKSLLTISAS